MILVQQNTKMVHKADKSCECLLQAPEQATCFVDDFNKLA
jgi:hypothetical protein